MCVGVIVYGCLCVCVCKYFRNLVKLQVYSRVHTSFSVGIVLCVAKHKS